MRSRVRTRTHGSVGRRELRLSLTRFLSIGWTSPAREQGLIYKQISFFECKAVEVRVGRVLFLGRAKALAFKEAKRMWSYIMKMVYSPVTE